MRNRNSHSSISFGLTETILVEYIAFQLKNRVSFRKAMKKAIELTKKADIKGVKIKIAGIRMETSGYARGAHGAD
jgi:ribosomal protein S3